MDLFRGHKLIKNDTGFTVILYLNANATEFAEEISNAKEDKSKKVIDSIENYIKENFRGFKITVVKLMLGSAFVASFVLSDVGIVAANISTGESTIPYVYKVQESDSLWKISQRFGVSIDEIKALNNLTTDIIYVGQELKLRENESNAVTRTKYEYYTVQSGDSLWKIANMFGLSVTTLKQMNNMTTDVIYPGQKLIIKETKIEGIIYTVKPGDSLWKIAQTYGTTVDAIKNANDLVADTIVVGQELFIPTTKPADGTPNQSNEKQPVYDWPDITYIVQPGDTVSSIAKKFNTTIDNILKYNYMEPDEWLSAGDKIAISGYAPRTYTVTPGESPAPARVGKLVDWITEGQYIIKRGDVFTVVDVDTGKQFTAQMIGGYNHADIEPLTIADTEVMKSLFGTWQWSPRAVVIYIDGINIAASLSGMPHDVSIIENNGVSGHFDLYLLNSTSHSANTSNVYLNQHREMVYKAAGQIK